MTWLDLVLGAMFNGRAFDRRSLHRGLRRHGQRDLGAPLILVTLGRRLTSIPRKTRLWSAFILTRPLGAVFGDLPDTPIAAGGLAPCRCTASIARSAFIVPIVVFRQRRASNAYRHRAGR